MVCAQNAGHTSTIEVISSQYWKVAECKGHMDATKHWKKRKVLNNLRLHIRTSICLVFATLYLIQNVVGADTVFNPKGQHWTLIVKIKYLLWFTATTIVPYVYRS